MTSPGIETPPYVAGLGEVVFATYVANYLLGLWVSLSAEGAGVRRRVHYLALQLVLLPIYTTLEGLAVMYALAKPERGFHVVAKEDTEAVAHADDIREPLETELEPVSA